MTEPDTNISGMLAVVQMALYGETAIDVVRRAECIECRISKIDSTHFRSIANISVYVITGLCQACQDKADAYIAQLQKESDDRKTT